MKSDDDDTPTPDIWLLRTSDYELDREAAAPWLERIGRVAVEFHAIEAASYDWLYRLDRLAYESSMPGASAVPFQDRVAVITSAIQCRTWCDAGFIDESTQSWCVARHLGDLRDILTQRPAVFLEDGTAHFGSFPAFRLGDVTVIDCERLDQVICEIREEAQLLRSLLDRMH